MDPLSITASSIAVLSAISGTSKGIGKLTSLRRAPIELQSLSNEIEALRCLLSIVHTALRRFQGTLAYQGSGDALCTLLAPVQDSVLELQSKIEYQLKRSDELDKNGLPKVSRTAWLRSNGEIQRLREKIRDARANLLTGLATVNLQIR